MSVTAQSVLTPMLATADRSQGDARVVVQYDGACPMCVMLADFSRKKMADDAGVEFRPSPEEHPQQIVVQIMESGVLKSLAGRDAWSWLLEHHPSLRDIHWIASKIGLTSEVSGVIMRGADMLRKFCMRCR